MDVKWLDDFLVLAECRSFTRAARLRNTSQSGLSRRIQSLEQWIGSPLVDRDASRFGLTEAGQRFLPLATHLRNAVVAARELCGPVRMPHPASCVTLAVAEGLESGVLPQLLSRLKLQGFDAPVRVVVKGAQAAAVALLDGDADMWLAPQHPQLPLMLDPMSYEAATVAQDRLSPIVATNGFGRPLYALPGLRDAPTPLLEYGMADYLAQVVGMVMASAPLRASLRPVAGSDSLHSLCTLVRQGLGLAFLPESMVREELRRGELMRADARWSTSLEIRLVRAGRAFPRSPADAAQRMWHCLVEDGHGDTVVPWSRPPVWPAREACPLGR